MTQTTGERDYVLGTHDEELLRLGLQHRVWRPRALDAWRRAGFTVGQTLIDVGCGPGYAAVDLAEIVGPSGRIIALDRSQRFLAALQRLARRTLGRRLGTLDFELKGGADHFLVFLSLIVRQSGQDLVDAVLPKGIALLPLFLGTGNLATLARSASGRNLPHLTHLLAEFQINVVDLMDLFASQIQRLLQFPVKKSLSAELLKLNLSETFLLLAV